MKYGRWIALVAAVAVVTVGLRAWRVLNQAAEPVPALTGVAVDGRTVDLAQSLAAAKGKPVMVVFWATWCPDCLAEQAAMQALAQDYPLVAIAWRSEDNAAVAKHMAENKLGYPSLNDVDGAIAKAWDIRGVPTHFIIAPDGKRSFRVEGSRPEWNLRARLWWIGRQS